MTIDEIVEKIKNSNWRLPEEVILEAERNKEKIIPKLLDILEYTKKNLKIVYIKKDDTFWGCTYAFLLLAKFRVNIAFKYLIYFLHKNDDVVRYVLGNNYLFYLPRLLASTYNGDDETLFNVIARPNIDEKIKKCVLDTFVILYLNKVKNRTFLVEYFRKLLNSKNSNDRSLLYYDLVNLACYLKFTELKDELYEAFSSVIQREEHIKKLKEILNDGKKVSKENYPFKTYFEYICDVTEVIDEFNWFSEMSPTKK